MTTNSRKCVKWRSLEKVIRGIKGVFRDPCFFLKFTYFLHDSWIKKCLLSSWIVKSVLFSLWIVTRALFFAYPLTWEIQIRINGERRCVQVASFELFLIHTVWRMQASHSHTHIRTWSHRVCRKFGISVFKMTNWCGNPRIVTASMNIARIANFLVALI